MSKAKKKPENIRAKITYFQSDSQKRGVGRTSLLFGSGRMAALMSFLVLGSAITGFAVLQKSKPSSAATFERIVLQDSQCTRTISAPTAITIANGETLCLNPGTYTVSGEIFYMNANAATITTTPSKIASEGKAKIIGKFNVNGDDNRILNLYIDGIGNNSGTILTPNGTDNTIIQGNDITSTAKNKTTTDQNVRQGICLNIGSGGGNLSAAGPKNTVIDRNRIFNCGWGKYDQAIYLSNNQFAKVTNNYVYDNPMFGLQFYPDSDGAVVENNLFDRNGAGITFSGQSTTQVSENNIFRNNIVSNSGYNPYGVATAASSSERSIGHWWGGTVGTGNQADYNCVINGRYGLYKSGTNTGYTKIGNIDIPSGDPLFTNAQVGANPLTKNFTLLSSSPCIGKGPVDDTVPPPPPSGDGIAPTVLITAPTNNATVSGTNVSFTASASDDTGVVGVQFKLNGSNVGSELTTAPYTLVWDSVPSTNGAYSLTAVARDAAGNTATSTAVTINVNNIPTPPPTTDTTSPTVSISAPANNASISGSSVTLTATATDNIGVSGVQFKLNGSNIGSELTTAPYTLSWNSTTVADGSHTLTAVARDAAGNTATSAVVTLTVGNTIVVTPTETTLSLIEAQNATSCKFNWSSTLCSSNSVSLAGSGASNNNFVVLSSNTNAITQVFNAPSAGSYKFGFVAKSKSYRGDAQVDVYVDNVKVTSGHTLPTTFSFNSTTRNLTAGSHSIKFVFINDKCGNTLPRESCNSTNDRNAWIDQFKLVKM